MALEHTFRRATSSTKDKCRVDVGWRNPKDLQVRPRLSSSRDVPRNEEIWVTMLVSMRDRSTVTATTTGSTSWLPSCRPRRRSCSFSDSSSEILRRSSVLTRPPPGDFFSLFPPPSSAILVEPQVCAWVLVAWADWDLRDLLAGHGLLGQPHDDDVTCQFRVAPISLNKNWV